MRKKIAVVTLLIIAAATAWLFYPRDGKLRPVSEAEGLKLLAHVRKGVAKNQSSANNGCGRTTMELRFIIPEVGEGEEKTIYDLSFAGDSYKAKIVESHARNKAPQKPFWEKLRQFSQRLVRPGSAGSGKVAFPTILSGRELTRSNIYSGNKQTITEYNPRKKQAHVYEMGTRGAPVSYQLLRMAIPRHSITSLVLKAGTERTSGSVELQRSEPAVLGHQRLGGNDCIVIEQQVNSRYKGPKSRHLDYSYKSRYWVCPDKGYCVVRTEFRGHFPYEKQKEDRLLGVSSIDIKEYKPGVWGASKLDFTGYSITDKGKTYIQNRWIITYDPNFQLNVPKSKLDLKLKLPKGMQVTDEVKKKSYVVK